MARGSTPILALHKLIVALLVATSLGCSSTGFNGSTGSKPESSPQKPVAKVTPRRYAASEIKDEQSLPISAPNLATINQITETCRHESVATGKVLTSTLQPNAANQIISIQISVKDCQGNTLALNDADMTEDTNVIMAPESLVPYNIVSGGMQITSGTLQPCNFRDNNTHYDRCTSHINAPHSVTEITINFDYSMADFYAYTTDEYGTIQQSPALYETLAIGGIAIKNISDKPIQKIYQK